MVKIFNKIISHTLRAIPITIASKIIKPVILSQITCLWWTDNVQMAEIVRGNKLNEDGFCWLLRSLHPSTSVALLSSYAYIEIPTNAYIKGIAKRNRDMFSLEYLLPLHISFTFFSLLVILGRLLRILIVLFANTWSNFLVRHIFLETEFLKKMMFDL
ncbi:hypothetical protein C4D60_Mb08t27870 [Musa balbisiana]|uniref:Uncharacterized protein n=1 Tax=Musa balbisiana TaxID=52838 RepID=A0A4S8K709_MUSBA|nr:hypothetical protein C4D60_Mb08t27870 [Musa balbisiana]